MSRSRVQVDQQNKKSTRYQPNAVQAFNDDFEELRMITNEDCYGLEVEANENSKVSGVAGTEQSDFRKLP